ncbi:MAG: hypothetical protein ACREL9_05985 [Gemmatimonadales bacterium]
MSPAPRFRAFPVLVIAAVACARAAAAQDDVLTALTQARTAYSAKNYQEAATQLQTALQFLNQLLVDQLKTFLPAPPPGDAWKAEDAQGSTAGMAGLSASRHYLQEGSEQTVEVEIVGNSPLIATMRVLVANPMMMGNEGRLVTVKGQKCVEKFAAADKSGELTCLPGSSMMVTIKGQSIPTAEALWAFANAMDFAGLLAKFP